MSNITTLKKDIKREHIMALENAIQNTPGSVQGDSELCPLKHYFADGVYVREIFIPKDVMVVGKIHKHAHPYFIQSGEVSVATEEGLVRIKAPFHGISPAGVKRAVLAHEDTVWITIHVTDETDLLKIEDQVIAKSYKEFEEYKSLNMEAKKCLGQ